MASLPLCWLATAAGAHYLPSSGAGRQAPGCMPVQAAGVLTRAASARALQQSRSSQSSKVGKDRCRVHAAAGAGDEAGQEEDASLRVKIMLAESSGRLDLSECQLSAVPAQVFEIEGLEELSLAGNQLASLPPEIGRLTSLQRLQLSGNELRSLPAEMCALQALQGLWLHGNRVEALPHGLGALRQLTHLSLSGNDLTALPEGISTLCALRELAAAGNRLAALPAGIGGLASLEKLSLHGNQLTSLPPSISALSRLKELWVQGNPRLAFLPAELAALPALEQLSAADCALVAVPSALGRAPALQSLTLYGNALHTVPAELLHAPALKSLWVEGNPLLPEAVAGLLRGVVAAGERFKALGLDSGQVAAGHAELTGAAGGRLQVCDVPGAGPGYFKLERSLNWHAAATGNGTGSAAPAAEVLVVAFGSAPGVPNWGGLMRRVRDASSDPRHNDFDVLYVVDPHRSWYGGGDATAFSAYFDRLSSVTQRYRHVIMVGDSMGATGALLFAELATLVHAFCPQVDLARSSIRPACSAEWQAALRRRVLLGAAACRGRVVAHVGNWKHDLDQVNALPPDALLVQVYSVDSHRLALALDRGGRLLPVLRAAILNEMGLSAGNMRPSNLL